MTGKQRVTALVPAYQAAGFIHKTLDSLALQTHPDFEVIISVDLCQDATYAICQDYCARYPNFKVSRHDCRLGYVGNCNYLLSQADSEYALFAFHDDELAPDYLEKLCGVLDRKPEAVMSYSDVLLTHVDGQQTHWAYREMDGLRDRVKRGRKMLERTRLWWVPNRGIFRLAWARRINGLKRHGAGEFSSDWPWLFHMSLLGEFVRVPETLCYKFYKPGSLSRQWAFSSEQWFAVSLSCLRELWRCELTVREKLLLGVHFRSIWRLVAKIVAKRILPKGRASKIR